MKKILVIVMILLLTACKSNPQFPDYNKLTRIDFYYDSENVKMLEDIDTLKKLLSDIKWQEGMPKYSREKDVTVVLFIMEDETKVERLYTYKVWYTNGGRATIIDEEHSLISELDKSSTKQLKRAFSCENGCTDAP